MGIENMCLSWRMRMAKINTYREIIAWQKGMELAKTIYRVTRQMSADERFGLTMQMRRAAISVPSNIAEGFGRERRPDLLRFLRIARGSLNELMTQYELATSLNLIEMDQEIDDLAGEADRVLQAFIRSLNNKNTARQ